MFSNNNTSGDNGRYSKSKSMIPQKLIGAESQFEGISSLKNEMTME